MKEAIAQMIAELLASRTARRPCTPNGPPSVRSSTTAASNAPAQPTVAITETTRNKGSSHSVKALGPVMSPSLEGSLPAATKATAMAIAATETAAAPPATRRPGMRCRAARVAVTERSGPGHLGWTRAHYRVSQLRVSRHDTIS
ncbi:hypothetical protein GCM10009789_68110 [Kribbella sancticallisti]|uniref:Uncharacterized protein n=1 Tax=Kribbella sancticallisti TaxID=460087 RepID=A0ABP4QAZ1_9ACTN